MSKSLLSLTLCALLLSLVFTPMAPSARAENVQYADLDGDGIEDAYSFYTCLLYTSRCV